MERDVSSDGGKIIFLHGASSSGKSTIARALQARIDEPFWHISIDHLRDAGILPSARITSGEFKWPEMRAGFFDGFHQSLAAYAQAGNNLILEHILDTDGWLEELGRLLAPYDVFFVGLQCSREELLRREAERGDRQPGSAEHDLQTIHTGKRYDLELNAQGPVEAIVAGLLECWKSRRSPSVFDDLAAASISAQNWSPLVPEFSCSDFEASLAFYRDVLGFEVRFDRSEKKFAYLNLDGAQIMLEQANNHWLTGELIPPFGRGINFQIDVKDVSQLRRRLMKRGVRLFRELETSWYRQGNIERGVSEFLVQDPDGYLLRFSELIGERACLPRF